MNYYIILNDYAGSGNARSTWPEIKAELKRRRVNYELSRSKYPGHATVLARQFAKEHVGRKTEWVVIAVGGDGTLHQVLNGLDSASVPHPIPVAHLPVGSGNDFARGLKMGQRWQTALDQILNCTAAKWLTIGQFTDTIKQTSGVFTNNLGIGFDAAIVASANSSKFKIWLNRIHLGTLAYALSFFNVVYNQDGFPLTVRVGKRRDFYPKAFLVTVSNQPYFGGGVNILPNASLTNSLLDLIVIEKPNLFKIMGIAIMVLFGWHLKMKSVHHYHEERLHLIVPSIEFGQIDGEELGGKYWDVYFETKQYPFWIDPSI